MAHRITRWFRGALQPPPPRAVRGLLLLALAVLAADGLIAVSRVGAPVAVDVEVGDDGDLRRQLEIAAEAPAPWLLIGDSVLAGDVMAGRVDDWGEQRVIDHMRRHRASGAEEDVFQVAANGLLPGDIEAIVADLDRVDPGGRVAVAIEINPRYFSAVYADAGCSRDWLCDVGPAVGRWGLDVLRLAALGAREARIALGRIVPLARHRAHMPSLADALASAEATSVDAAAGKARIRRHYAHLRFDQSSGQWQALSRTVRRLRSSGRRALFFATPLADDVVAGSRGRYTALMAALSGLIDTVEPGPLRLVSLDHPLFGAGHFIDHCHLWPAGNRLLALNLLHAMNVPTDHAPRPTELVAPEGPDRTLMAQPETGYRDGAGWDALTRGVAGLAVAPGGRRLVIADTGTHTLREMIGDGAIVRTLAGTPGRKGHRDGPADAALITGPADPVIVGDDVWFTTDGGRRLRRLRRGHVTTAAVLDGPTWRQIRALRAHGDDLIVLDGERGALRYDPIARSTTSLVARPGLEAVAVAPDGRMWVVDARNRVLSARADRPVDARPVFANTAAHPLPDEEGAYFPYRFDQVRLLDVTDLVYVERYDGLLVRDTHPTRAKGLSAVVHLRFLSLGDRRVYPWMKPRLFGWSELVRNAKREAWVSPWHRGAMAYDQVTGALFTAERDRSRVYMIRDGLLGAAKLSNTPTRKTFFGMTERYGARSGRLTQETHRPDRHLDGQRRTHPREGPFVVLLVGSSYLAVSDLLGPYSFGRRLEAHLSAELGHRAGIAIELYQRTRAGGKLKQLVDLVGNTIDAGLAPDVLLFGLQDSAGTFLRGLKTPADIAAAVDRLRRTAARYDTRLIALDSSALIARNNEGLRRPRKMMRELMAIFEGSGIDMVRPGAMLLADHLDAAPWGAPPYDRNHPSPWAIDAAAARVAHDLAPRIEAHLKGRIPARNRPPVEAAIDPRPPLAAALRDLPEPAEDAPIVPPSRLQTERSPAQVRLFVDVADAPRGWRDAGSPAIETLALATVRHMLEGDPGAAAAREIRVRVARFDSYDEYGQGALDDATVLFDRTWSADTLASALKGR